MNLEIWARRCALVLLAPLAAVGGCDTDAQDPAPCPDDGTCDDDDDDDDVDIDNGGCGEETTSVLTDLSTVPPGFEQSAGDLIASIEATYGGKLTWRPNDGPVTVGHAETNSALTLSVAHDGGEVRLIEVALSGQFPNGTEGGTPCSNRLEIDTTISFATEDGLFEETWDASIEKRSVEDDFSNGAAASLYRPIDFSAHEGTLMASDFSFQGAELRDVIVTASFGDGEVSGGLLMEVQSGDGEDGWIGAGDVASFSATASN